MRLLTFLDSAKKERVGILLGISTVIDASEALGWLNQKNQPLSLDMLTVIREQETILPAFSRIVAAGQEQKLPSSLLHSIHQTQIVSPIPRPVSMRDGYAFR